MRMHDSDAGSELTALLDINRAITRHLDRDMLFGALATSLRNVVPTDRFGIELPIEGDRLQGHLLTAPPADAEPTHPTILPAAGTACHWVMQERTWIVFPTREQLRERFPVTFDVMQGIGMESLCALPLVSGEHCRGALFFMAAEPGAYAHLPRHFLEQVAGAVAVALDNCLAHEELARLRDQLALENIYLRDEVRSTHDFHELVGESVAHRRVLADIERVAPTGTTVLLTGETGTGKELVARAIHALSPRAERPLVKVNAPAIPTGLVESELFGHERGAFSGAVARRVGRFELADRGTIFLDEIGELPLDLQPKLLRVLQEGEVERVGGTKTLPVDVRVIAATNRRLPERVRSGQFRSDLYYRLNVFPIRLPPLRERATDIPLLAAHFCRRFASRQGKPIERISERMMRELTRYPWPGNVRELEHVIERAVVLSEGSVLAMTGWSELSDTGPGSDRILTLAEAEYRHVLSALEQTGWRVSGPRGAARILGLKPTTLEARMRKLGITRPEAGRPAAPARGVGERAGPRPREAAG